MIYLFLGHIFILDQGNSKLRVLNIYNGTVSTYVTLLKDVKFEAMYCTYNTVYLSANDQLSAYIYTVREL